jgi:hypothetical protein
MPIRGSSTPLPVEELVDSVLAAIADRKKCQPAPSCGALLSGTPQGYGAGRGENGDGRTIDGKHGRREMEK